MELASPVAALALGCPDRIAQPLGRHRLRRRHRRGCAGAERLQQPFVFPAKPGPILQPIDGQQRAELGAPERQRDDQRGGAGWQAKYLPEEVVGALHALPLERLVDVARHGGDDKLFSLGQEEHQRPCLDQGPGPLDDRLEDPVEVGLGADGNRDLCRSAHTPQRELQLLLDLSPVGDVADRRERHGPALPFHQRQRDLTGEFVAVGRAGFKRQAGGDRPGPRILHIRWFRLVGARRLRHQKLDRLPDQLLARVAEEVHGERVGQDDDAFIVDGDGGVGRGIKDFAAPNTSALNRLHHCLGAFDWTP